MKSKEGRPHDRPKSVSRGLPKAARFAQYAMFGRHAVEAALANPERVCHELFVTATTAAEADGPVHPARARKIPVTVCDGARLDKLCGGGVHQGMALRVSPTEHDMPYFGGAGRRTVMILDHVSDPQNIGAVIRSCGAFGADAVFVHERGSPGESGALAKAACGLLEKVKYIPVKNVADLTAELQKHGFSVAALDAEGETPLHQAKFAEKQAFLMGSEGKGVRRLPMERADLRLSVPMTADAESLNISVAAGVCLYARYTAAS